ncbi:putative ATP-binding component of ABC transporter [Dunaliella salina]|uniref:ATP-binding component of ABC transporter n=1 Tax=Dunaliella salina TaxID=3046 RepID=A0ABQ7GHN1_DUNSA|nr:putative ATP-binding component of ABC transporter [Dunaliella salina]|eukprot:KAF5834104.1 putative ATP-binding component of ABC transporter [Dunaliella salina]
MFIITTTGLLCSFQTKHGSDLASGAGIERGATVHKIVPLTPLEEDYLKGFRRRQVFRVGIAEACRPLAWHQDMPHQPTWLLPSHPTAKKKGGKGGGGGGGGGQKFQSPGDVKSGAAYSQETRRIILSLDKVSKVTPQGKELLKNINLGMYLGAKIGILGANGSGKSTLMKILAQQSEPTEGRVQLTPGITIGYLEQEPQLADGETVMSNIEPAVQHIKDMVAQFESISMQMSEPGADVDALASKMDRLQIAQLSGGERRRVALARLLLNPPDILLLDEPTNHLDALSVAWLESFLGQFKGTVVAVTHDRYFLDNVAGWILELDRGQGIPFEGNYSEWLEAKDKRLRFEEKTQSALQKSIAKELEWTKQQQKGQQVDSITIPVGPRLGSKVIEAKGITKAFGDRLLVDDLNFSVPPGSVVGIIGGNGAGKSTLFKIIMGQEKPEKGELEIGETVVPMYVDQSRDALDPNRTVYEEIAEGSDEVDLNGRKVNTRAYCSWYNFKSTDQNKKVGMLSGGERNRLHLAKTLKQSGNLLLLDEPTNDLDVETLRCLEEAIDNFAGSVLIISHDRWFLDRMATHILAFEDNSTAVWFEGNFSEYEEDRRRRTGQIAPTRIKFRRLANV